VRPRFDPFNEGQPGGGLFGVYGVEPPAGLFENLDVLAKGDQLGQLGQAAALQRLIVELGAELGAKQQVVYPAVLDNPV
jgi:hypothetical protein